jgi:hypothetical protein
MMSEFLLWYFICMSVKKQKQDMVAISGNEMCLCLSVCVCVCVCVCVRACVRACVEGGVRIK